MTLQSVYERALMEGRESAFDYILAEALGKTLDELMQMSNNEYIRWQAFYAYRDAMAKMEKAQVQRRTPRGSG